MPVLTTAFKSGIDLAETPDTHSKSRENRELRSAVRGDASSAQQRRKVKKLRMEIYSDMLDELSGHNSSYRVQDHRLLFRAIRVRARRVLLPAHVPRGADSMMMLASIQVTLSEGQYQVARFQGRRSRV